MNSKTLSVLGLVACMAIGGQAFAASPQLQGLSKTEIGTRIMSELGVSLETADLGAALTVKYGAAQAAVIMKALGQFNQQYGTSTDPNGLAQSVFKADANGKIDFAALSTSNRTAMKKTSVPSVGQAQAQACSVEEAADTLNNGTDLSPAEAQAALREGLLVRSCKAGARGVLDMSAKARTVAARAVLIAKSMGVGLAQALATAKERVLGIKTTAAEERAAAAQLQSGECEVFSPALAL